MIKNTGISCQSIPMPTPSSIVGPRASGESGREIPSSDCNALARALRLNDPCPDLVNNKRPNVSQYRHVNEGKHRPAPAIRLAANHGQGRDALTAECEEHHQ